MTCERAAAAVLILAGCGSASVDGIRVSVELEILGDTAIHAGQLSLEHVELMPCGGEAVATRSPSTFVPLTATGSSELVVIEPSPGRYCDVEVAAAPLGSAGQSLRIEAMTWTVTASSAYAFDLVLDPSLTVDDERRRATLRLTLDAGTWLNGVDGSASPQAVLQALGPAMTASTRYE